MRTFGQAYRDWRVEVSEQGNARLCDATKTPILVIRASKPTQDPEDRKAFGREILASLFDEGLVATAKKFKAHFSPRFAQVVDHAVDDMKEFADKYMHDSVLEGAGEQNQLHNFDITEQTPDNTRTDASQGDDMEGDVRGYGSPLDDVLQDGVADNAERPTGFEDPVAEDNEAMREKRKKMIEVGRDSVLDNETHDHTEPVAEKKPGAIPPGTPKQKNGEYVVIGKEPIRLGTRIAAKLGADSFVVTGSRIGTAGTVEYQLIGGDKKPRTAEASLLEKWIMLDKTPAVVKIPGQSAQVIPQRQAVAHCAYEGCKTFVKEGEKYCASHKGKGESDGDGEPKEAALTGDVAKRLKQAERAEKFAQAKLEKAKKTEESAKKIAQAEIVTAQKAAVEAFCRALRIVAARQAVDLEQSPLKQAAEAVLSEPRPVGTDAATGEQIVFKGLDPELTRYMVAQLYEIGHADHLEQLMKRASDLMTRGDQYLLDAEADLKNIHTALPTITMARTAEIDEAALRAAELRAQARTGNLRFAPAPTPEEQASGGVTSNGHDKRAAIRGALGGTLVETARGRLGLRPN
jgi:hypothetical protein